MSRNTPWRTSRKMYALNKPGQNDWYRIRNQINGPTQLYIYDEIGYFGVSASDLIRDLADVQGPLEVHVNSPGGEVFEGIAIYNALIARKDVTVMIDGIAASIASAIAMAGNPVLIARQGQMMIHDGFGMAIGNAADMREMALLLDRTSNNIAEIYADHTGKPTDYWRQLMQAETWYGGQDAIDAGLADRFIDSGAGRPVQSPKDTWDMSVFRGAATVPYVGQTQTRHEPMTGKHNHDHSAHGHHDHDDGVHSHDHVHNGDAIHDHHTANDPDGDGDNDSSPSTDTDHDYWTKEGKPIPHAWLRNGRVMNWDAAAAYAKCHSAGDFKSIAFEKSNSSDPASAAHYGLPHHATPHGPADRGGVIAALGRWNQTQDLKNKDGALDHLKSHARDLGLPAGDDDASNSHGSPWLEVDDEDVDRFLRSLKGV